MPDSDQIPRHRNEAMGATSGLMHCKRGPPRSAGLGGYRTSSSAIAAFVIKRKRTWTLLSTLSSPAIRSTNHAAPCRQALGRMLLHPLGELRRAHQARLYREVSEVRRGDGLLAAVCRRGETAEHGDDLDHDRRPASLRWALAPLTE
jgi:hypothetical protein